MSAALLTILAQLLLSLGTPASLADEAKVLTEVIPEGRVLAAETEPRSGAPVLREETLGPDLTAMSYVVIDVESGKVLTSQNPSAIRPVASLTKLLTAVTVREHAKPDDGVTVGLHAVQARLQGSDMRLRAGERMSVRDLLAGLLITSANDAAVALAEHVAGSEKAFAEEMNRVARSLGLTRTHMVNATGLDNVQHFSSSYDMALLLTHVWRDPLLGVFVRAKSLDVRSIDGKTVHHLQTTNRLLGERTDVLAGKTGFTDAAGESLAIVAEDDRQQPVVAVILGSEDRFRDMANLLNWTFWAYTWPEATNNE